MTTAGVRKKERVEIKTCNFSAQNFWKLAGLQRVGRQEIDVREHWSLLRKLGASMFLEIQC